MSTKGTKKKDFKSKKEKEKLCIVCCIYAMTIGDQWCRLRILLLATTTIIITTAAWVSHSSRTI